MIKPTHKHISKHFKGFQYLVQNNRVFMMIDNEWKRSTMDLNDLIPIGTNSVEVDISNHKPLIAKERKSNREILFNNIDDAVENGFCKASIILCLTKKRATHKEYEWRLVS